MTTAELILEVKQDHCPKCGHGSAGMYWDQEIEELACRLCGWRSGSRPAVLVLPELTWLQQPAWAYNDN